jgi:hypothetical protein
LFLVIIIDIFSGQTAVETAVISTQVVNNPRLGDESRTFFTLVAWLGPDIAIAAGTFGLPWDKLSVEEMQLSRAIIARLQTFFEDGSVRDRTHVLRQCLETLNSLKETRKTDDRATTSSSISSNKGSRKRNALDAELDKVGFTPRQGNEPQYRGHRHQELANHHVVKPTLLAISSPPPTFDLASESAVQTVVDMVSI